jgi:hypothetical protein
VHRTCKNISTFYTACCPWIIPCITVHLMSVHHTVHHSTIHRENPTKCNNVTKFYYSVFIWSSTCFGRHTAHHQEPKTVLAASGFSYVEGCWTCSYWASGTAPFLTTSTNWYLSHRYCYLPLVTVWQIPDAVDTVVLRSWWWVEVPPETCRAVSGYKYTV